MILIQVMFHTLTLLQSLTWIWNYIGSHVQRKSPSLDQRCNSPGDKYSFCFLDHAQFSEDNDPLTLNFLRAMPGPFELTGTNFTNLDSNTNRGAKQKDQSELF